MNEPCMMCGSEPTLATYYDFYRFHCPTPGCPYHLGVWKVYSGNGKWYGSIDEARDAWNQRQRSTIRTACRRGETPSAPETVKPEPEPADVENRQQDGSECDTREQLEADMERLIEDAMSYGWKQQPRISADAIELLDRQAAITANETNHNNPYVGLVRGKQWERTEISDYYCGRCGWKVTDHDSYCPECGGALHKASNKPDSKFDARKTAETPETCATKEHIRDFDDTREKLEADVRKLFHGYAFADHLDTRTIEFLDRQDAITHREVLCQPDERDEQIAELTAELDDALDVRDKACGDAAQFKAERDKLNEDCSALDKCCNALEEELKRVRAERNMYRWNLGELENNTGHEIAELLDENGAIEVFEEPSGKRRLVTETQRQLEKLVEELTAERDKLLAELEAYRDFDKAEFAIPLDEAMKFTTDPPGYVKKHIAELQAENKQLRGEWESERDYADQCEARAKELAAKCDCLNDVVRKQADSFAKMERELHDAKVEAEHNRDGVESLKEKCQAQREELARFNAKARGKRRIPKKVVWPRDEKGKLVTLNALGAKNILFDSHGYLIEYRDGTTRYETYKQAKEAADEA